MSNKMKYIESTINDEVNGGLLEYSMYTVQNRAIPSAIDGFKPVHRKLVYAMTSEYANKKVKLAELGGGLAKYNFHHGEASAMSAGVTLTAEWNNNCPVFTGHGNFGSRLIQEAAAPRYIFASLSPSFSKYFIDVEVAPKSSDVDNPEPAHYLPIIPWVLVNGIEGIATGFACDILPRSIPSIVAALKTCIKDPDKYVKSDEHIPPSFPHFRGIINKESDTGLNWSTTGIVDYVGKYTYKITELPIGYDRESYVVLLNKLIDTDKIRDYEDNCSESGFGFSVKVSGAQKEVVDKDPIAYFKLKKMHSENLTTLGSDGKLKIFKSVGELVHYFYQYRLAKFGAKIFYDQDKLSVEIANLKDKMKFISDIVDDEIPFKTSTKAFMLDYIAKWITPSDYGRTFINIPLYSCTRDEVEKLDSIIKAKEQELVELSEMTPVKLFNSKLSGIK